MSTDGEAAEECEDPVLPASRLSCTAINTAYGITALPSSAAPPAAQKQATDHREGRCRDSCAEACSYGQLQVGRKGSNQRPSEVWRRVWCEQRTGVAGNPGVVDVQSAARTSRGSHRVRAKNRYEGQDGAVRSTDRGAGKLSRVYHLGRPQLQTLIYLMPSAAGSQTKFVTRPPLRSVRPATPLRIAVLGTHSLRILSYVTISMGSAVTADT